MRIEDIRGKYRGRHAVCGLGPNWPAARLVSADYRIAVNDARVPCDFHVVLDTPQSFAPERQAAVRAVTPKVMGFATDRIGAMWPLRGYLPLVFAADRGFRPVEDSWALRFPKSRQSPFVAACLALWMGATELYLCGVDLTNHPQLVDNRRSECVGHMAHLTGYCSKAGIPVYNCLAQSGENAMSGLPGVTDVALW
jgi:hypothetical protein